MTRWKCSTACSDIALAGTAGSRRCSSTIRIGSSKQRRRDCIATIICQCKVGPCTQSDEGSCPAAERWSARACGDRSDLVASKLREGIAVAGGSVGLRSVQRCLLKM